MPEFIRTKGVGSFVSFPFIDSTLAPDYFSGTTWSGMTNEVINAYAISDGASPTISAVTIANTPSELGATGIWRLEIDPADSKFFSGGFNKLVIKFNADEIQEQTIEINFEEEDIVPIYEENDFETMKANKKYILMADISFTSDMASSVFKCSEFDFNGFALKSFITATVDQNITIECNKLYMDGKTNGLVKQHDAQNKEMTWNIRAREIFGFFVDNNSGVKVGNVSFYYTMIYNPRFDWTDVLTPLHNEQLVFVRCTAVNPETAGATNIVAQIKSDADSIVVDNMVDIVKINGLDTDGYNATLKLKMLDIQNATGHAINAEATGATGNGLHAGGGGSSGAAMYLEGGGNEPGLRIRSGGGVGADGVNIEAQDSGHGIDIKSGVNGGSGIVSVAQGTTGDGLSLQGSGSGKDINADEIDSIKAVTDNNNGGIIDVNIRQVLDSAITNIDDFKADLTGLALDATVAKEASTQAGLAALSALITGLNDPSAATIRDTILNAVKTSFTTAGSIGEAIMLAETSSGGAFKMYNDGGDGEKLKIDFMDYAGAQRRTLNVLNPAGNPITDALDAGALAERSL